MRKLLIFLLLFGLNLAIRGQSWPDLSGIPESTNTASLRYWFNDDATIQTTTTLSGATTIDASALVEGVHVVHYQVVDNLGKVGIPASKLFIRISGALTASKLRYWFDDDVATITTTTSIPSGVTTIDASALADGIHIVHYQVIDNQDVAGIPASKLFIRISGALTASKLRYWFDDDVATITTTTSIPSGVTTIDASALADGIHTVHYQIVDNNGTVSIPVSKMFMKLGAQTVTATDILYWFDENDANIKESKIDLENLTTTVDASSLTLGEHVLNYQLKLSDGTLSPVATATFQTTQSRIGDANNDGDVNVADIVVIQIFMGDNTKPIHFPNADVNEDKVIDTKDVNAVKNIIIPPAE